MREALRSTRIRAAVGVGATVCLWGLLEVHSLFALPVNGGQAPPLTPIKLLQAPSGASPGWANLKGKVVVLEFWATWCAPCVEGIPHLNQLVKSLDPAKFQFISIDDEDQKLVRTFLTRKKMDGWVGVDSSGAVFKRYGVMARPTTIIVNGAGKIVAAIDLATVTASDLQKVGEGKHVTFKPPMAVVSASTSSTTERGADTLFAVSLSKAQPDTKFSLVRHSPTGTDMLGADADHLITLAYNPLEYRLVLKCSLPDGRYDLRETFTELPSAVAESIQQAAVTSGLHLQVQPKTVTKPAYILKATEANKKLLEPSASAGRMKRGYWNGRLMVFNGTMDDLAYVLATGLENPVINETGIEGKFDVQLKFTGGDLETANAALKNGLGLELVPGKQEMPLTVFEVSKQEERGPSSTSKTPEPKP